MLRWLSMLAGTKLKTAKEVWVPPSDQPEKYLSQKEASFDFDQKVHETLVANADIRGQQRLKRKKSWKLGTICTQTSRYFPSIALHSPETDRVRLRQADENRSRFYAPTTIAEAA